MEVEPSKVQLLSTCFTHGNLVLNSEWGQTDLRGVIGACDCHVPSFHTVVVLV